MDLVLRTWWSVSAESYAEDNGIDPADADRDCGWYITSAVCDVPELAEAEGYAYGLPTAPMPWELDGRLRYRLDWRVEVDRERWAQVRQLDLRAALLPDLGHRMAFGLFHLGGLCGTDAVMRAVYRTGRGVVDRTWRPEDRFATR
ncbi:hypothetical protein [Streptomyces yaizuensis]|uniref:Uncharacterized protein n=1 Tax=Streptomyces yaizuensis TaxID=2989713 RepID=A0AA86MCN4_9ACTN|nr:hypothetical protein [Streptomyces sp. YSPA8]BDT39502.1 hypothetical protein SYYSPA8_36920 [Streptomyces sp. YSPA8]